MIQETKLLIWEQATTLLLLYIYNIIRLVARQFVLELPIRTIWDLMYHFPSEHYSNATINIVNSEYYSITIINQT